MVKYAGVKYPSLIHHSIWRAEQKILLIKTHRHIFQSTPLIYNVMQTLSALENIKGDEKMPMNAYEYECVLLFYSQKSQINFILNSSICRGNTYLSCAKFLHTHN